MKRLLFPLLLTLALSLILGACGTAGKKEAAAETNKTAKEMTEAIVAAVEQPNQMELDKMMVDATYHLDPSLLEDFSIRVPLMNVKSNEIAVFKIKDAKDIPTVEAGAKQRAADVQKMFETYLPDQYENAKNYKLVTKGNYVFFAIGERSDELVEIFEGFFGNK